MDAADEGILLSSFTYDFTEDLYSWQPGFSEYPAGPDDSLIFELKYAYAEKPSNLAPGKAIMLSGNNHSGDLFMFLKKKLDNLKADSYYTLTFNVEFASNAPTGMAGGNGGPGDSVFFKVGGSSIEPKSMIQNGNHVMNIDKGNQNEHGSAMINIGNIATMEQGANFQILNRTNSIYNAPFEVKSNSHGELWIIIGTDSSFKGVTTLYYTKINVVLSIRN
jgi:hypothetical protein